MRWNVAAKPEVIAFSIEAPGGAVWRSGGPRNVSSTGQLIALRTTLDESFYRAIKDQPIVIRGDLFLTLYGDHRETKVPVRGAATGSRTSTSSSPVPSALVR